LTKYSLKQFVIKIVNEVVVEYNLIYMAYTGY